LATNSNDPGDIRQGVIYTGQQTLIGATSALTVTVLPLHFVGSKGYSNGAYLGFNPVVATVTVPAAPTVGLKRIDVLYVVQQDAGALVSADGTTSAVFGVHAGVASSTPAKPALTDAPAAPVGAIEVGTITWDSTTSVPTATNASAAGASCTLATTCLWTATRADPIAVRSQSERDGTLTPYDGLQVYRLDTHAIEVHNGTTWSSPRAISTKVTSNVSGITGAADVAIVTSSAAVVGDGIKRFKITASYFTMTGTVSGDAFDFKIKDQSTGVTLTAFRTIIAPNGTEGKSFVYTDVPAAGSHIYQFTAIRGVGTGTGQVSAGTAGPAELIVEQV
jgi:hypothetical protein